MRLVDQVVGHRLDARVHAQQRVEPLPRLGDEPLEFRPLRVLGQALQPGPALVVAITLVAAVNARYRIDQAVRYYLILFVFAIAGTGIIGAALAGWASDNKYSLLGGLRAA